MRILAGLLLTISAIAVLAATGSPAWAIATISALTGLMALIWEASDRIVQAIGEK